MPIGKDRLGRELRRYQLAMRLMIHEARTQTICDWTGLTRERLKTLRHEWSIPSEARHRGPSPTSLSVFFRSPRARGESSALAVLCRILGAIPSARMAHAARRLPSLDAGEQLCDAFEAYQVYFPRSGIEFEQAVLLVLALAQGDALALQHCTNCDGLFLIDRFAAMRRICSHCQRMASVRADRAEPRHGEIAFDGDGDDESASPQQVLF